MKQNGKGTVLATTWHKRLPREAVRSDIQCGRLSRGFWPLVLLSPRRTN